MIRIRWRADLWFNHAGAEGNVVVLIPRVNKDSGPSQWVMTVSDDGGRICFIVRFAAVETSPQNLPVPVVTAEENWWSRSSVERLRGRVLSPSGAEVTGWVVTVVQLAIRFKLR